MEIAGVLLGTISVMLALYSVWKSHGAQRVAEQTRRQLGQNAAIADLTRAIEQIQALKELHVRHDWERAVDRYAPLRQRIQAARTRHPIPSEEEMEHLQSAVAQITEMENEVRFTLRQGNDPSEPDMLLARLNSIQVVLEAAGSALANEYNAGEGG